MRMYDRLIPQSLCVPLVQNALKESFTHKPLPQWLVNDSVRFRLCHPGYYAVCSFSEHPFHDTPLKN